jgi:hypothetical protein
MEWGGAEEEWGVERTDLYGKVERYCGKNRSYKFESGLGDDKNALMGVTFSQ